MKIENQIGQIGQFIRFGQRVTIDQARRILRFIPESREETLVEFDSEGSPSDEELDLRITSY